MHGDSRIYNKYLKIRETNFNLIAELYLLYTSINIKQYIFFNFFILSDKKR